MQKSEILKLRVEEAEKAGFTAAAELDGASLSAWARARLRQAALRELEAAGLPIPFIDRGKAWAATFGGKRTSHMKGDNGA